MIVSLLFFIVLARAIWRCAEERWMPGVVAGVVRIVLVVATLAFAFHNWSLFMTGSFALQHRAARGVSAVARLALLVVQLAGPVLSCGILVVAYRRYSDLPAREEEKARRPFSAWLPVGVLDVVYVLVAVLVTGLTGDGFGPSE